MADMRINATIDTVFEKLMPLLSQPIPPFILRRRMLVTQSSSFHDETPITLQIQGIDTDGTPVSLWKAVRIGSKTEQREPHTFQVRGHTICGIHVTKSEPPLLGTTLFAW